MKKYWYVWVSLVLIALFIVCGCGLQWVPPGQTPIPGARPIAGVVLDAVADADAAGWGDLATVLASLVGGGGVLAVGRKFLKNHRERRDLRETNTQQDTALREIIRGVQEIIGNNDERDAVAFKDFLAGEQSTATARLVSALKFEIENGTNRD